MPSSASTLRARAVFEGAELLTSDRLDDRGPCEELARMLSNARYWLSFEVAKFEPLLTHTPPPLNELGVGVLLRYGEDPAGELEHRDLDAARREFSGLPPPERDAFETGLELLGRAITLRERAPDLVREGFRPVRGRAGVSPSALQSDGTAAIEVNGEPAVAERVDVRIGEPFSVSATDERGRLLPPPEVSSQLGATVWLTEADRGARRVLLAVPGTYILQVPGRARGVRTLLAS